LLSGYTSSMTLQCGELWPTSHWDRFVSLGHPSKFQRVSRLGSIPARHSSSGRPPNFAALNQGCHLYLARQPSRWPLAHVLVCIIFVSCISSEPRAALQTCILNSHLGHTMCGSMVDIQSAAAEIRRGIKQKIEARKKPQGKNIMALNYIGRP